MCQMVLYEGRDLSSCSDLARVVGQGNVRDEQGWILMGNICLCWVDISAAFQRAGLAIERTDDVFFQWASPAEAAELRAVNEPERRPD